MECLSIFYLFVVLCIDDVDQSILCVYVVTVAELNLMYRLFESCDKEAKGVITADDFFTKILKIRRTYYCDSLSDLIGACAVRLKYTSNFFYRIMSLCRSTKDRFFNLWGIYYIVHRVLHA
jgi:hypothetical protein